MNVRAYSDCRASGVEWIGSLPVSWNVRRVSDIVLLINGFPFDSNLFSAEAGIPLVRIRDLNRAKTEAFYLGDLVESAEITSHDLLIGMDGDFNVGRWKGAGAALLNQRVCCLRGSSEVVRWLEYVLPKPLNLINDITYSTTVKHLSSGQVRSIRVPFPDSDAEKITILNFLDRETGKIDGLVAEQNCLVMLLKEKRQAVISQAVTKGLNPNVPMIDSGIEWLGQVPAHWEVKRLKFIAVVQGGIAKGKDVTGVDTVEVPYLRVANVQDGYLDLNEVSTMRVSVTETSRYLLRKGDVLMNEGGDFDKLGRGQVWNAQIDPCIHQNHVFAVRPHSISASWLTLITSADCGRHFFKIMAKQSTNLASISSSNLMELPLCCPPLEECERILNHVAKATKQIDTLITEAGRAVALLRERRAALIFAAVTGKNDVRGFMLNVQEAA